MTVGELKKMLKPISNDVVIVMGILVSEEENILEDICFDSSLIKVDVENEMEDMFVLLPCYCDEIIEPNPQLN